MQTQYFPALERGKKNIGRLKSNFFFSFSDYYHPLKTAFGTSLAFNDDYMEIGKGFGIHPHINMEIISAHPVSGIRIKLPCSVKKIRNFFSLKHPLIRNSGNGKTEKPYSLTKLPTTHSINFSLGWGAFTCEQQC